MNTPLPSTLLSHTPWTGESHPIWIASSFILRRNLNAYPFPDKMDSMQKAQVSALFEQTLAKSSQLKHPLLFPSEALTPSDKEFLFEHFLCLEGFEQSLSGQGFVLDDTGLFLGLLNMNDHLRLQFIDYHGEWEKTWEKINQLDNELNASLDLAYDARFGYLTAHPHLSGTGLTGLIYLHLPALIHTQQLETTLAKCKPDEVTATSMQGSLQEMVGDLVVLKNTYTLGVSEENILHALHLTAIRLMNIENALRSTLKKTPSSDIKDLVSRSFGLLAHSYQLQTKEAMQALSLLKLGLDLGWISHTTHAQLNTSSFQCRRAHLLHQCRRPNLSAEEILHHRAEWLHPLIHTIQLTI